MSIMEKLLAKDQAEALELADSIEAIGQTALAEDRDITEDEQKQIDQFNARIAELSESIPRLQKNIESRNKVQADKIVPQAVAVESAVEQKPAALPARAMSYKSKHYATNKDAYDMGMWLGALCGNQNARQYCRNTGLTARNDLSGGSDTGGGYSVPQPLQATVLMLMEQYGVFRANARTAIMTSNTLDVPKYDEAQSLDPGNQGIQVDYPGENTVINKTDLVFDQVNLVAKKMATLTLMSTELSEDSVINVADMVARDIAHKMAHAEDTNAFLGDGGAGFNSITGIQSALQAGAKVTLGGTGWADLQRDDLHAAVGKIAMYGGVSPKWYMSSYAYQGVIMPLLTQLGGVPMREFEAGGTQMLLGYPVVYTQVLPKATIDVNKMAIVFGDLELGAYSGQRRQLWVRILNELYAAQDSIGIQSTLRHDCVTHSVGNANVAGAIVGIYTAAA